MTERNDRERRKTIRLLCRDKKVAEIRRPVFPADLSFRKEKEGDNDFSLSPSLSFPILYMVFTYAAGSYLFVFPGDFPFIWTAMPRMIRTRPESVGYAEGSFRMNTGQYHGKKRRDIGQV